MEQRNETHGKKGKKETLKTKYKENGERS